MATDRPKILVVDDERNTREALARYLKPRFEIVQAEDGEGAIKFLQKENFDLVLTDLRMPGIGGMGVLEAALSKADPPACIVFTAFGSVEKAVEAVKAGAFDFMTKPVKFDRLDEVLNRALAVRNRPPRPGAQAALPRANGVEREVVLGSSPEMQKVIEMVKTVAPTRSTVLLTGESGSGKEVVARALHRLSGRTGLFVPVHCAALPGNLLESELFGHEKGAFTGAVERRKGRFELADKGTLFLDEIGEIEPSIQVKLLRVLETRTFERLGSNEEISCDVRLIAATNRDLEAMVREGTFRDDLFYRLNVVNIELPPLRRRTEDIPALAGRFKKEFAAENGKPEPEFGPGVPEALIKYPWPGNVRELRNCIERMVVLSRSDKLTLDDVPESIRNATPVSESSSRVFALPGSLEETERETIERTLNDCGGNRTLAAKQLGISRRTLQRRLKSYR